MLVDKTGFDLRQNYMGTPSDLEIASAAEALDRLTKRQTAVMELAAQHKSNKLIARELDISPSTVEQRIAYVRDKLETTDRNSSIRRFVELRSICGQPIYAFPHLDITSDVDQSPPQETKGAGIVPRSSFLEAIDAQFGRWGRIGLVIAIAISIAMIGLLMMSIATSLSVLI